MYVYVIGHFGDSWLSRLFPGCIGYSSHPYKMIARVIQVNPDGSAVVTGSRREETGYYEKSPITGDLIHKVIYTHFDTEPETVEPGNWRYLTNDDIVRENGCRSSDRQMELIA